MRGFANNRRCPRCDCILVVDGDYDDTPTLWCDYCSWPKDEEE